MIYFVPQGISILLRGIGLIDISSGFILDLSNYYNRLKKVFLSLVLDY
jgi:hypothetical protein